MTGVKVIDIPRLGTSERMLTKISNVLRNTFWILRPRAPNIEEFTFHSAVLDKYSLWSKSFSFSPEKLPKLFDK